MVVGSCWFVCCGECQILRSSFVLVMSVKLLQIFQLLLKECKELFTNAQELKQSIKVCEFLPNCQYNISKLLGYQ